MFQKSPNIREDGSVTPNFKCGDTAYIILPDNSIVPKRILFFSCNGTEIWYTFEDGTQLYEHLCYKSEEYARYMLTKKGRD